MANPSEGRSRQIIRTDAPPPRSSAGAGTDRDGRVIHGDLSQIAGQPWTHALLYLVVAAAAGVDIVTFHQVLLLAMNETEWMLWLAVVGFTVVALALGHYTGAQAKHATNPRNVAGARATAWICFAVWLLLGATAFVFRFVVAEPVDTGASVFQVDGVEQSAAGSDGTETQYMSALLFLSLYIGTGTISGLAGFIRHSADAKQYNRAVNRRTQIARRHARSKSVLASANQLDTAINRVRDRREDQWTNVEAQCTDAARRLKQEARLYLLAIRGPEGPTQELPVGRPQPPQVSGRTPAMKTALRRGAAIAACMLLATVAACDDSEGFDAGTVALSCPVTAGGPVTLVVGARANSPDPDLPTEIQGLVREAAKQKQKIQIVRVDGTPTVALTAVFNTDGKSDTQRTKDLDTFIKKILKTVTDLQPKTEEADVLAALTEAAHVTPPNGTVVLIDSGLTTTGPLSFRESDMFGVNPEEVALFLDKQKLTPKLTDLSVVLVGIGNTAEPQPQLDENLHTRITKLWHTIVEKAGAGCVADLPTPLRRAATERKVNVSVVKLPEPVTFAPCGTTILADSDAVGFIVGQSTMRDPAAGRKTLQQLADQVKTRNQRITLVGNTSSEGDANANKLLSQRRAEAIKQVLVELGVEQSRIETRGDGSNGKYHINDRLSDGTLDPKAAAHNRSVVVELVCPKP